jgi:benzoyl-CoA 2,3-dioxygenase component B
MDLFGADVSSNAATFYSTGLKGRFNETKIDDDHVLANSTYPVLELRDDVLTTIDAPLLNALNERLRDDFIRDVDGTVGRWNRVIERSGLAARLSLPHKAFHRKIGPLSAASIDPRGRAIDKATWDRDEPLWLPSEEDRAFVASLMGRVATPGKFAHWIAPPSRGVDNKAPEFEYVRFN